jgi:hypothetical protein
VATAAATAAAQGTFGLLNKFGMARRLKTASLSQVPISAPVLLEGWFFVTAQTGIGRVAKLNTKKKKYVVLDSRTLHVLESDAKGAACEDQLLLLFCFVRSGDAPKSFTVYSKTRLLVCCEPADDAKVALWADLVASTADKARDEELSGGTIDPRELIPDEQPGTARGSLAAPADAADDDASDDSGTMVPGGGGGGGLLSPSTSSTDLSVIKAGYLSKRNKRGKFKKRWIVLKRQLLLFYNDANEAKNDEVAKESLQLLFCSAKPATSGDAPHGFSIFAKDQTHEFSAASAAEQQSWLSAIQSESERLMLHNLGQTVAPKASAAADAAAGADASEAAGTDASTPMWASSTSVPAPDDDGAPAAAAAPGAADGNSGSDRTADTSTRARALQDDVEELMLRPENAFCADCSAPAPEWCSVNIGLFMCIECSGQHRRLGAHISKVRSTTLDMLLPEHIAQLRAWGNVKANEVWEALPISDGAKPTRDATSDARAQFIVDKYKARRYHSKSRSTTPRGAKSAAVSLPTSAAELHTAAGRRQLGEALVLLLSADAALRTDVRARLLPDDDKTADKPADKAAVASELQSTSVRRKKLVGSADIKKVN